MKKEKKIYCRPIKVHLWKLKEWEWESQKRRRAIDRSNAVDVANIWTRLRQKVHQSPQYTNSQSDPIGYREREAFCAFVLGMSINLRPTHFSLSFISSLKLECEKLAQEKTEIQRQYIMVSIVIKANTQLKNILRFPMHSIFFQYYEMSYGLNVEMHKQVSMTMCDCNFYALCHVLLYDIGY